jgi:uncharacterized membrane protein YraQ (UPF0718 family)
VPIQEEQRTTSESASLPKQARRGLGIVVWLNLGVLFYLQGLHGSYVPIPALHNWGTIFLAVTLQALPFLVLGVGVGAAIVAFVPAAALARVVPRRPLFAVPVAGLAGGVLPGCECSAAPVANRLVARGVEPAAALTFLLAAPAINPIVIVATAVAFPAHPEMALARFVASLLAAVTVGWIWSLRAGTDWLRVSPDAHHHGSRLDTFVATATGDFVQAGGFLVIGAGLVATLQTLVPGRAIDALGGSGVLGVLTMACLAVLLSVCSEADAFVAAGLTQFSLTARLVFLVVGPMVDLKLIALQVAVFGRTFAIRFAPLVFATAIVVASVVGWLLL